MTIRLYIFISILLQSGVTTSCSAITQADLKSEKLKEWLGEYHLIITEPSINEGTSYVSEYTVTLKSPNTCSFTISSQVYHEVPCKAYVSEKNHLIINSHIKTEYASFGASAEIKKTSKGYLMRGNYNKDSFTDGHYLKIDEYKRR